MLREMANFTGGGESKYCICTFSLQSKKRNFNNIVVRYLVLTFGVIGGSLLDNQQGKRTLLEEGDFKQEVG